MKIYWAMRLWWMNNIPSWHQIAFDFSTRWDAFRYSLSVRKWHKPCIECWGSKTSVKYGQLQDCRLGCGVGYQRIDFWDDMKNIFYPSQKLYELKLLLTKGCTRTHPWGAGECLKGTLGCKRHR